MANKTANIDYICIIREDNGKALFETLDIPVSVDLISRLEGMSKNDNATVLDMQAQMNLAFRESQRGPINYVSPYSYGSSYIDITYYPSGLSYAEYSEKMAAQKESLRESFSSTHKSLQVENPLTYQDDLSSYIENNMAQFEKGLKQDYLRAAKRFICAFNYRQTLNKALGQGDVRMYSTDTLGWSDFSYQVTNDITITLGTNFGYGSASYFRLGLRYKGIDVLPYSYLVKYYYANRRDLLRYTRLYDVAHDSWNLAFGFVEEVANKASESEEEFVRHWILNEIKDMVHRLHSIFENPVDYIQDMLNKEGEKANSDYFTVRNMDSIEKRRYGVCPEEMTMAIRAEKITGALGFLDNLSTLSTTLPEIEAYINEIKEMAVAIIPDLDEMVRKITATVAREQEEKANLEVELAAIKKSLAPYEKAIDALYENRSYDNRFYSRSQYETNYANSHKDYEEMKIKEANTNKSIVKLADRIFLRSSFRDSLLECRARVVDASLLDNEQ